MLSRGELAYFAYGSNLLFARLHARTPSIRNLGVARLDDHRLHFNKPGGDGSGKCGIEGAIPGEHVLGVAYAIHRSEKPLLDEIEGVGHGYAERWVDVCQGSEIISAFTYYPTRHDHALLPFDWYRNFVLQGARENNFPVDYIARIASVEVVVDPDEKRRNHNYGISQRGPAP